MSELHKRENDGLVECDVMMVYRSVPACQISLLRLFLNVFFLSLHINVKFIFLNVGVTETTQFHTSRNRNFENLAFKFSEANI